MKKILLVLCIPLFLFGNMFAVDNNTEVSVNETQEVAISTSSSTVAVPISQKETYTKVKKSKIKKFFKRLNPFKKAKGDDFTNYVIAFLLGLLLGLIGILIAFLIYLNHDNRKRIMNFAWIGWLWWLVIFSLILL